MQTATALTRLAQGLSLRFYTGDAARIARAACDLDFDTLSEPGVVLAAADISLHLEPRDLDTLSVAAAASTGQATVLLRESLETVRCDDTDHGAFIVGGRWVSQIASIPSGSARSPHKGMVQAAGRTVYRARPAALR